ncbi:hypothetical protein BGZ79_002989 [Entomortierella chlamydospora]|nr:hypothetical protein BGZ79_002989 [Entomortierella chlamydospora]
MQFSLAPSILSQRATVVQSGKDQPKPQDKNQYKGNRKGRPRSWTLEEDIILYNTIQDKRVEDFYHRFPGRTVTAVSARAFRLRNACFVTPEKGGLVETPDMTVAQRVEALREILYKYTIRELKEGGFYDAKAKSTQRCYNGRHVRFSDEEMELLVKLVHKYRNDPDMWAKVSGGRLVDEEGAPRLNRSVPSCKSAWSTMNRNDSIKSGVWDKHEERRLEKAIRSQVGDEYEIRLDMKEEGSDGSNQSATARSEPTAKPALRIGSSVLQGLDWEKVASEVGTRTAKQSRYHFYYVMHNGETGKWTAIETEKLLEGYKLYGRQWVKVAAHIGNRSAKQKLENTVIRGMGTSKGDSSNLWTSIKCETELEQDSRLSTLQRHRTPY